MALKILTCFKSSTQRTAFQLHTMRHKETDNGEQIMVKFFDEVENSNTEALEDTPLRTGSSSRIGCKTCNGSSHCLNLNHQDEIDIAWGLRPMLLLGTIIGYVHKSNTGKRCCQSPSYIYSLIFCISMWANFFRLFANYAQLNSYGTRLFMTLILHIWTFQICFAQALFFHHVSPRLTKFFALWNSYSHQYHCTSAHFIRTRAKRNLLKMLIFLLCLMTVASVMFIYVDPYDNSVAIHFLINKGNVYGFSYDYLRLYQILITIATIYCYCAWIWPVALFTCFTSGLIYNFKEITATLSKNEQNLTSRMLEDTRRRHQKLCTIVRHADDLFSVYVLLIYVTVIPLICFTIYNFAFRNSGYSTFGEMILLVANLVIFSVLLLTLTTSAASLSNEATAPKEILFDIPYDLENKTCHLKALQIMLFLHRLSHSHIGFTAWKFVNITRGTIMTVTMMVLSNVFVLMKFGLSLEPGAKVTATNCTSGQ